MIGRFARIVRVPWATLKLLTLVLLVAAPEMSLARPRPLEEPPTQDGDPTADDQPSPSPKGGGGAGRISGQHTYVTKDGTGRLARERHVRLALQAYLRLIARISLR